MKSPESKPQMKHGAFSLERTYRASIERVYAAWSDPDVKARWFVGPRDEWKLSRRSLDLRVGGAEILEGRFRDRTTYFAARYHVVEPNERLVYAYDMYVGDVHLSVSLASLELRAAAGGTTMTYTEQGVYLDGEDGSRSRERGTAEHFDRLADAL